MKLKQGQLPIVIINILAIILFSIIFLSKKNYEFILYIGVILFFIILILATSNKVNYPNPVLWGLTSWSLLHMSGGGLTYKGKIFYSLILIPIVGEPYNILKYDQFVHILGFLVATLVMYYLIKPLLIKKISKWIALSIVIVMAGLGVGALNEIIEFIATILVPETGVGGYINTSLDLVSDLIGSILAVIYLRFKEK